MRTMTTTQLKSVKNELTSFYKLAQQVINYFNRNPYITVGVLLQNAQFYSPTAYGYNHQEEVNELMEINDVLHSLAEYYDDDHVLSWIKEEVGCIIDMSYIIKDIEKNV